MDIVFKKIVCICYQDIFIVVVVGVECVVVVCNVKLWELSEEELCQVGGGVV